MTTDDGQVLRVPAREIPVPSALSPEAKAVLARGLPGAGDGVGEWPAPSDRAAWKAMISARDAAVASMFGGASPTTAADITDIDLDDVTVYEGVAHNASADDGRVLLSIHGGALIMGGGAPCRSSAGMSAAHSGVRTWAVDYRMPPDHPYPTPLDDCVTAYKALLEDTRPTRSSSSGGSAGGNLAAALVLRVRDEGLPLPAAVVLLTPELDLTESGDTFQTNLGIDTILGAPDDREPPVRRRPRPRGPLPVAVVRRLHQGLPADDPDQRDSRPLPLQHGAHAPRAAQRPASRPSCTCSRRRRTAGSSAWRRRTASWSGKSPGS